MGHQPRRFTVGDRVLVHGGYDGDDSDWLRGGPGYRGTVRKLTANAAAVELDDDSSLKRRQERSGRISTEAQRPHS